MVIKSVDLEKREWIVYIFLILAILVLGVVNLFSGSSDVSIKQMLNILSSHDTLDSLGVIVWQIRVPRMIEAAFLGGALALSGYLLQSFFANPIAGPYVLGISSGAKLFVAILMVCSYKMIFNMSSLMMVVASFVGSCLAAMTASSHV